MTEPKPLSRCDEQKHGYYLKIDRGQWTQRDGESVRHWPTSGLAYSGNLTKEQHDGLDKLIRDYLEGKVTSEKKAIRYMRYPKLDRRFVAGDDYAGDAYVRWVAVGQKPDDAGEIIEAPKREVMVTPSMVDAAAEACDQPPFITIGRLDLARIIRAALEVK